MYSSEKEMYETPAVQVVEVKVEGVICGSPVPNSETEGHGNGYGYWY
jgi:hypothetical protein